MKLNEWRLHGVLQAQSEIMKEVWQGQCIILSKGSIAKLHLRSQWGASILTQCRWWWWKIGNHYLFFKPYVNIFGKEKEWWCNDTLYHRGIWNLCKLTSWRWCQEIEELEKKAHVPSLHDEHLDEIVPDIIWEEIHLSNYGLNLGQQLHF